jgi:hypothetical protein
MQVATDCGFCLWIAPDGCGRLPHVGSGRCPKRAYDQAEEHASPSAAYDSNWEPDATWRSIATIAATLCEQEVAQAHGGIRAYGSAVDALHYPDRVLKADATREAVSRIAHWPRRTPWAPRQHCGKPRLPRARTPEACRGLRRCANPYRHPATTWLHRASPRESMDRCGKCACSPHSARWDSAACKCPNGLPCNRFS